MSDLSSIKSIWALRAHVLAFVAISLVQVLIWWNTTPDQFFWPLYSILGWGVWVAFHAWFVSAARRDQQHTNQTREVTP